MKTSAALCWLVGSAASVVCSQAVIAADNCRGWDVTTTLSSETLDLYEGPLLPADDHPMVLAARERLHTKFIKLSTRFGDALADGRRWGDCVRVLERALEFDPANQPLAARLTRVLGQQEVARTAGISVESSPARGRGSRS